MCFNNLILYYLVIFRLLASIHSNQIVQQVQPLDKMEAMLTVLHPTDSRGCEDNTHSQHNNQQGLTVSLNGLKPNELWSHGSLCHVLPINVGHI